MQQGRKGDRRGERSGRPEQKKAAQGSTSGVAAATTTVVTESGETLTISDLVTRFDEAAQRRLHTMNQKLRRLEMQMEVLEAEMSKANDASKWS
ncbi:hypothetical protein Taro_007823 [Colocasia esculenta]|uniref:Uncharacterized protein n=1 Tax=Colocasia esculenta TaxID=4460 RepID=A0A843U1F1_COLES|nr:hypothetical protein [Colocasia esculenta]